MIRDLLTELAKVVRHRGHQPREVEHAKLRTDRRTLEERTASFMLDALTDEEVRAVIARIDPREVLVNDIPGVGCPPAKLARDALAMVKRHGLMLQFLEELADVRPYRANDVEALAREWRRKLSEG